MDENCEHAESPGIARSPCRRQLFNFSDDMTTEINIQFYSVTQE